MSAPTPVATHTSWGEDLPEGIQRHVDGWSAPSGFSRGEVAYPAVPELLRSEERFAHLPSSEGPCGDYCPTGRWHCKRPRGHDGIHIAFNGNVRDSSGWWDVIAEWGDPEAFRGAPETPSAGLSALVTPSTTSWGAPLSEVYERTPGAYRYVLGRHPWESERFAYVPEEYRASIRRDSGTRCEARHDWSCSLPLNHTGHHIAFDNTNPASEGGWRVLAEWYNADAPASATPSEPVVAPEGFITANALREETRRLAQQHQWCSQHHEPLSALGVEPLGVQIDGTLTVTVNLKQLIRSNMYRPEEYRQSNFSGAYGPFPTTERVRGEVERVIRERLAGALGAVEFGSVTSGDRWDVTITQEAAE